MAEITIEEAKNAYKTIKVHAPTLNENLSPKFELVNMECPCGKDGQCGSCDKFMGVDVSPTGGRIFSFHIFEGFCNNQRQRKIENS